MSPEDFNTTELSRHIRELTTDGHQVDGFVSIPSHCSYYGRCGDGKFYFLFQSDDGHQRLAEYVGSSDNPEISDLNIEDFKFLSCNRR